MKGTKLYYLTTGDILKGRVEPILWMKTCKWLSKSGFDTKLVSTYFYRKENVKKKEIFKHFGVAPVFKTCILPSLVSRSISNLTWCRLNYFIAFFIYLFPIFIKQDTNIFYSKNRICMEIVCLLEKILKKRQIKIYEIHKIGTDFKLAKLLTKMQLIIVNCNRVKNKLIELGVNKDLIITEYLAPHSEGKIYDKKYAKEKLNIDKSKIIVTYVGKMTDETVNFFIDSAKLMKNPAVEFHIGGGNPRILKKAGGLLKLHKIENIIFHGFIPPSEVSMLTSASDILFSYHSNSMPDVDQLTPAKIFDYLHARKPVLCSNNTAIQEIFLDSENCIYFSTDETSDFCNKLNQLIRDENMRKKLIENNKEVIQRYTWQNRTFRIADNIKSLRFRKSKT